MVGGIMENCCDFNGDITFRPPEKCTNIMFGEGFPASPPVFLSKPSPLTALESLGYSAGLHLQPNSSVHGLPETYRSPATATAFQMEDAAFLNYFGCGTSDGYQLGIEDIFRDNHVVGSCVSGGTVEGGNGEGKMHGKPNVHQEMYRRSGGDDGSISHSLGKKVGTSSKKSSKNQKKANVIKGQWSAEEDRLLRHLVDQFGLRKWSHIAQMLKGRVGKQCRERWHNHLRPNIKKDTWTEEEERMLIAAHSEIGNKWAEIAKRLPGRTENSIKNHWNATKRRQLSKKRTKSMESENQKPFSILEDYIKGLSSSSLAPPPSTVVDDGNHQSQVQNSVTSSTPPQDQDETLAPVTSCDHSTASPVGGKDYTFDDYSFAGSTSFSNNNYLFSSCEDLSIHFQEKSKDGNQLFNLSDLFEVPSYPLVEPKKEVLVIEPASQEKKIDLDLLEYFKMTSNTPTGG